MAGGSLSSSLMSPYRWNNSSARSLAPVILVRRGGGVISGWRVGYEWVGIGG